MAETIGEAVIVIGADVSKFRRDVEKEAKGTLNSVGAGLESAGKTLTKSVTAPIVGAGLGVLKMAGDFESSMQNVSAITGATGQDFAALQETAKELGRTTVFSASEAAEGMTFLGMAGFETDEIIGAMPGTLALAAATATDLGTAADIASNILTGFGLEASEAGRMADVLAKGASSSNTDLQQLGDAMTYVAPVAAGLGASLEETTAAIGLMSDAGIQGSMAGTSLRGALSRLANPTGKAAEILADLGVQTKDAQGELLPMADIIDNLGESGATTGQLLEIFGDRAGPAMEALVSQGGDALRDLTADLENAGGTAEQMADTQLEGLNGQMRLLMSAAEGLAIAVAESGLLEWVTDMVERVTEWVSSMAEANPGMLRMAVAVAAVAAAVGPLLIVVGKAIQSYTMMRAAMTVLDTSFLKIIKSTLAWTAALLTNPITWIVVGIGALVAALVWFFTKTETGRAIIEAVWGAIKDAMGAVVDWWTETAAPALIGAWEWVQGAVSAVGDWFTGTLVPIFEGVWEAIVAGVEWLRDAVDTAGSAIQTAWEAVGSFFGAVYDATIQPVLDGFSVAVEWLRDNVLPPLQAIGDGFTAVGGFIWDVYYNTIQLVFDVFAAAVQWLWDNGIRPIFDSIKDAWGAVASFFSDRSAQVQKTWDGLSKSLKKIWDWIDKNVFGLFRSGLEAWKNFFTDRAKDAENIWDGLKNALRAIWDWIDENVFALFRSALDSWKNFFSDRIAAVRSLWDSLKAPMRAVWDWIDRNVLSKFREGLDTLEGWVRTGVENIGSLWRRVANFFREPINGVINFVWNDGLKAAFDAVAGAVGSSATLPSIPTIPAFAKGGRMGSGLKLVGEEGPELIATGPGWVATASETRKLLNAASPHGGGVGQWLGDRWEDAKNVVNAAGRVVRDAAGNVVQWVRGGLAKAAGFILDPIFNGLQSITSRFGPMGQLGGDTMVKAKDMLLDWIRGHDDEAGVAPEANSSLRGARPYVNNAAQALASMVGGIRTMQAINQSMAGGHPEGRAVDFIDSIDKLDRLASAIVRTGGYDRFSYMAWQGRLWSPGRGWRPQGRGYGNDPFHRWHLHAEWFDKGGLLKKGFNVVYNGTGSDEQVANITGLVDQLRRGSLRDLSLPARRDPSLDRATAAPSSGMSREDLDYMADRMAQIVLAGSTRVAASAIRHNDIKKRRDAR